MPFDPTPVGIFLGRIFKRAHRKFHSKEEGGGSGADTEAIYNIGLIL
jgi:hypothetical protein